MTPATQSNPAKRVGKLVPCEQCGDGLVAARRSEHVSDQLIRHHWCCERCGYEFSQAVCWRLGA